MPDHDPASTEATLFDEALGRLAKFIATGPAPDRVTQAIGDMVAAWADEPDMSDDVLQTRIERLWDSFSSDAAELQAQLSDAEEGDRAARSHADRVLTALDTAVAVFAAIQR